MADTEVLRFEADTERGEILLTDGRAFLGGVYDVQLIVDKHEGDANYALALFAYENQAKPLYIGKVDGSGTGRISFSQRELIECYRPQARVWNASIPIYAYLYRPLEVSEAEQEAVEELPISGEAVNPVYIIATGRIDLLWTPIYGETKDKTPVTAVGPTGPQGMQGEKGKDGVIYTPEYRYVTGEDGVTVKEIYVDFVPNVEGLATIEGLIQLKGANGRAGVDGKDGRDGKDGKSSYEIAQEAGFVGSAQDWVDLISGLPTELRDTRQLIADTQAAQKVLAEGLRENARIVSTGVNKVTGAIEEANKQVLKIGWETNKGVNTIQEVTQKAQDALNNTVEEARGFANEAGTGALKAKEWSVSAESARDEARMWRDGSLEFATKAYEHRNAAEAAKGEAEGFKGQAEGFATQASESASNASTSATNAKTSETNAKEYATQAENAVTDTLKRIEWAGGLIYSDNYNGSVAQLKSDLNEYQKQFGEKPYGYIKFIGEHKKWAVIEENYYKSFVAICDVTCKNVLHKITFPFANQHDNSTACFCITNTHLWGCGLRNNGLFRYDFATETLESIANFRIDNPTDVWMDYSNVGLIPLSNGDILYGMKYIVDKDTMEVVGEVALEEGLEFAIQYGTRNSFRDYAFLNSADARSETPSPIYFVFTDLMPPLWVDDRWTTDSNGNRVVTLRKVKAIDGAVYSKGSDFGIAIARSVAWLVKGGSAKVHRITIDTTKEASEIVKLTSTYTYSRSLTAAYACSKGYTPDADIEAKDAPHALYKDGAQLLGYFGITRTEAPNTTAYSKAFILPSSKTFNTPVENPLHCGGSTEFIPLFGGSGGRNRNSCVIYSGVYNNAN